MMADAPLHALVIVSFLLVGVPSNVAVLWIHTRKNSRVAKNRFPLIFAALDLFALVTSLPLVQYIFETRGRISPDSLYLDVFSTFAVHGYLITLFMATVDKFYAVMFPYKYGNRRATIFKITVALATVPNAVLAIVIATSFELFGQHAFTFIMIFYNVAFLLVFLAIVVLYVFIIAKLIRNRRNLRKVNDSGG